MTSVTPDGILAQLAARYTAARDPKRAAPMAAYMRDQFQYFGLSTTARRAIDKEVLASIREPDERFLRELSLACWAKPEREFQYFAADLLRRHIKCCSQKFLRTLERLTITKSWWDTVDTLAVHSVGPLVAAHPELVAAMDDWIGHENIWLARTAILHQNAYKRRTDRERLFDYCLRRADESEFFIRKAIGWALREYSRTAPDAVARFLEKNAAKLSGLSRREALKRITRANQATEDE